MYNDKVTVVGFTGAGKTTYLAGMYCLMSGGVNNYSLGAVEDAHDVFLEKLWEMICNGEKPNPSDNIEQYLFHLSHNFTPVFDFEWLDYPGGILADPTSTSFKPFMQHVMDSACVLFILDGETLAGITAESKQDYKDKARRIFMFDKGVRNEKKLFNRLSQRDYCLPPVGIVVTKCDLIEPEYREAICETIRENLSEFFNKAEIVLPISVSLGGEVKAGFEPEPFNIEQPIAFAVLSMLLTYMLTATKAYNRLSNEKVGFFKDWFTKRTQTIAIEKKFLAANIQKYAEDALALLRLFPEDKVIYVGGKEQNLRDFYKDRIEAFK